MLQGPIMYQQHSDAARPAGPDVELIFNLAPLALLILSPTWRIKKASARFLADWRVTAADCIDEELVPFLQKKLHPRPAHIAHLTACIDNAIAARAERTTSPIDASHAVSWKARVIPVFNGDELLSIVLEWHEGPPSTLSEDELVKPGLSTDEAFRILVQTVKDYAIFLLDTKGNIVTWNTGAQLLKGYKREDIIGKHFSIFYGKEDLDIKKPQMELEICMREGRVEDEGWRYRKDGSRFWANVVITAVYKDGVHVGFGKVTRDLTERKSAESRLIAAYEESEKLKSDFLANMSHEIRTPMHGMLSACTLLLDTPLSARQRDIVNIMDESGQVLLQVINDILDYSKLASGSFSIHTDIVGITSIVTSVVRSVQASLPPSVHFELFLSPDLPRSVQGDPLRYRQILQNVVGNAAKFTDKGSIRVRASVQSEDDSSYLVLTEVTDTGIGVPEAAEATLFTPFMQFDTTTTKQYKGTGLGLSIAKSLTELMGGRIGYRPNPDRHGSIFWFTARFKKIKSLGQMQDWKRRPQGDGSGTPAPDVDVDDLQRELRIISPIKNLLVVEDNLINQKVVLGMLRSLGFKNVSLASNGMEAVRMVRGKPAAYDLVLMDVSMPIMDGQEATKEIRAGGILVPIVAMTAYALKGDRERCLEYGMNDYVAKPVDKKRLIAVLGKWLLRTTDYRKNYEERLAELRRNHPAVAIPATPGVEAKQFLFEVANGAATPPAEEPQPQGKSVNAAKLEAAAAGEASKGENESAGTTPQASKPDTQVAGTSSNADVQPAGTTQSKPETPVAGESSNGDIEPAGTPQSKPDAPVAGKASSGDVEPAATTHGVGLPTGAAETQALSQTNKESEAPGPNSDIKVPEMTLVLPARRAAAQQDSAAKQVWECPSAAAVAQQKSAAGDLKESADAAAAAERQESAVEEVKESPIAQSAEVPHHHVHPTLVHRPRQLSDSSGEGKPSLSVGILEHHCSS